MRFIVTGDNHLRPDLPLCRLDEDWMATQKRHLDFIVDQANLRDADIICTGDLFDVPRVPPEVVSLFINAMAVLIGKCYVIAGNHSLPWHKLENVDSSSVGILKAIAKTNKKIVYLDATEYTENGRFEHTCKLEDYVPEAGGIYVTHTLTFPSTADIPFGIEGTSAYTLLKKYPDAQFIFTGDYHHNFRVEDDGRYVINPGCMNIQAADLIDYDPIIVYVDTGNAINVSVKSDKFPVYRRTGFELEVIPMPNDKEVLTRNHLDQKQERDERISSFVETIMHDGQIGLSFEDNLKATMLATKVSQAVRDIITEVEEEA